MIDPHPDVDSLIEQAIDAASGPRPKLVTFGEAMLRMTPPHFEPLERATSLNVTVGGAELNVAVAAAALGMDTDWVSAVPNSPLGRHILRDARAYGVGVDHVLVSDDPHARTGVYFLEEATEPRASAVTYDRANSAFARLTTGSFDWHDILEDADILHISGITLALGDQVRAEALEAMNVAGRLGCVVAFDLNYRSMLWSEAEARRAFTQVIPLVDVLFASRGGLLTFFGIEGSAEEGMRKAIERLGVVAIAMSRKKPKGSRTLKLQGMAMGRSSILAQSDEQKVEVVDRLGGGDAFAAGFLASYVDNPDNISQAIELANTVSALKHTIPGDFLVATRDEVRRIASGDRTVLRR